MFYRYYNPNPQGKTVGDCTIRAISFALHKGWEETYLDLMGQGLRMSDMPSSNAVWGTYLSEHGFKRRVIPNSCPNCYTVIDFCKDNPTGLFVLATGTHVVSVENGNYYDTWDSGDEIPIFYWERSE